MRTLARLLVTLAAASVTLASPRPSAPPAPSTPSAPAPIGSSGSGASRFMPEFLVARALQVAETSKSLQRADIPKLVRVIQQAFTAGPRQQPPAGRPLGAMHRTGERRASRGDVGGAQNRLGLGPRPPSPRRRASADYVSQPLQGTEWRDSRVLERAERTHRHATGAETEASDISEDASHPAPHPIADPSNGRAADTTSAGGARVAGRQPKTRERVTGGEHAPASVAAGEQDVSAVGGAEALETSRESKSIWGALGSVVSSIVHPDGGDTQPKEEDAALAAEMTEREVNALVDEIVAQMQMRTKDEFNEHREFLEREQRLAVRAAEGKKNSQA
jgi:hypothetical protein